MTDKVTLADCPIGLFIADGAGLCLKTEYSNNARIGAYIVSSGEMFWGAEPQTIASQRQQMVTPIEVANVTLQKRPVAFRVSAPWRDGWMIFEDEEKVRAVADSRGIEYQGLYVREAP